MILIKQYIRDLAIFGAQPIFDKMLHVGRPNIGDRGRLMARLNDMLDSRWLTNNGPYVEEFEECLADYLGVGHCIAVTNATIGLELAIRALGLQGEVIVPSFTFVASAHALQWQDITPVFADVDPVTHNIDPEKIERLITPRTSGILGVHVWGRACDVTALGEITYRHGLKLLYDAAHAFGCSHRGVMIGGFGDAEVFSFHATKFFNTFEGGAVTTNNDALAEKLRLMRNFGFESMDNVISIGTNGKMSEVSAAMGLTSLESLDAIIETNRRNYAAYREALAGLPGIQMVAYDEAEENNYQYIVLEIDQGMSGVSRDIIFHILHAENVRARRYFYPGCHRMEPYKSYFPNAGLLLTETEKLTDRVLQLPTGTSISENNIKMICEIIRFVVDNADGIKREFEALDSVNILKIKNSQVKGEM
jgi:dTDP-4-amino-4,6-dideoxygalactose transaminase